MFEFLAILSHRNKENINVFFQGKHIYERGCKNGKRVQSNMGAKNHGVVLPDANKDATLNQVSLFGIMTDGIKAVFFSSLNLFRI